MQRSTSGLQNPPWHQPALAALGRRCALLPALHWGQETLTGDLPLEHSCIWMCYPLSADLNGTNRLFLCSKPSRGKCLQDQGLQDLHISLQPRARCPLWRALLAPVFVDQELYPVGKMWPEAMELGCLLCHHGSKGNVTPPVNQEINKK